MNGIYRKTAVDFLDCPHESCTFKLGGLLQCFSCGNVDLLKNYSGKSYHRSVLALSLRLNRLQTRL